MLRRIRIPGKATFTKVIPHHTVGSDYACGFCRDRLIPRLECDHQTIPSYALCVKRSKIDGRRCLTITKTPNRRISSTAN